MDGRWRIELLGQLRLCRGDAVALSLQRQKSTTLLAYLAYYPRHPHPREVLIELIWPEEDPEDGRRKLRSLLHDLRKLFPGQEGPAPGDRPPLHASGAARLLIAERTTVHLDPGAFTTDVAEFRAALQAAARAAERNERIRWLAAAVALYRGELLPGYYEDWVLRERQALAEQFLGALRQLAAAREEAGDLEGALAAARQAVSSDPLQEEAHYNVMRLAAALGQPSAALRQYQELERLLREELDETPAAEARALAEELRRNARTLVVARRPPPGPEGGTGRRGDGETGGADPRSLAPPAPRPPPAARVPGPSPRPPLAEAPRLPVQLTRFFGREAEITRLTEMLGKAVGCQPSAVSPIETAFDFADSRQPAAYSSRLVTVTGPGGSGKTRLAIAAAGRLQEQFGDAVAFVPLTDLTDAARIPDAVAAVLGLDRSSGREIAEQVIEHLSTEPWLLVLDNFEHLVEAGALLVRRLLERIPTLTCLVTSRQRLGLSGEQEFALLPLPTPRASVLGVRRSAFGTVSPKTEHRTPNT